MRISLIFGAFGKNKMLRYITLRLIFIFIILFSIIFLNFMLLESMEINALEKTLLEIENNINAMQTADSVLQKQLQGYFGLEKSKYSRFFELVKNYMCFNLGKSYVSNKSVVAIILDKIPTSLSLGLLSTVMIYLIGILLGYKKAKKINSHFDILSSLILVTLYVMPIFALAFILIYFFANENTLNLFLIGGLVSENFTELSLIEKIQDYLLHIILPVTLNVMSGLMFVTLFAKNVFLLEMHKQYYHFASFKGLSKWQLFKNHLLKNAIMFIFADFSAIFIGILFGSSLFIEVIFSLDGIGLLTYNAFIYKDYPLILANIYLLTLLGLTIRLVADIFYMYINPRIIFYGKK